MFPSPQNFENRRYRPCFCREIEEKNEKIAKLERRLEEETSLVNQEAIQKSEMDLRAERERREKLESSLANLQFSLQSTEMQYSEYADSKNLPVKN